MNHFHAVTYMEPYGVLQFCLLTMSCGRVCLPGIGMKGLG